MKVMKILAKLSKTTFLISGNWSKAYNIWRTEKLLNLIRPGTIKFLLGLLPSTPSSVSWQALKSTSLTATREADRVWSSWKKSYCQTTVTFWPDSQFPRVASSTEYCLFDQTQSSTPQEKLWPQGFEETNQLQFFNLPFDKGCFTSWSK